LVEAPAASRAIEEIRLEAQRDTELGALTPGSFTTLDGGTTVLYARESSAGSMQGVFIYGENDERISVLVAEEAGLIADTDSDEPILELRNGRRYVGEPGDARFYMEQFALSGIPIRTDEPEYELSIAARSTRDLMLSVSPEARAELHWRIAVPVSMLVLALLAVPLGRSSPREGKYARVGIGILIYIIYANSLSLARVWIERGTVPEWLGLWWVHAALFLLAIGMLIRQSGVAVRVPTTPMVRHEPVG
ncbi:MAG: LptF/LptG family permease, partial [Gammaproteobacteria bacterium]|nr:LptF/LptG family permease [Gammaproteobacteria bacterium]